MSQWTDEQKDAIYSKGENIIVSAGAGSGKTAVLSERVLEHVRSGIGVDEMLILTFTKAAAAEMKERIRKKLESDGGFALEVDKLMGADITTFDAYALSVVKKYNYLLNVSDRVMIADSGVMLLKRREFLDDIFDELYGSGDSSFLRLVDDFCLKDDKEIKSAIIDMSLKLDNLYDKRGYLEGYMGAYYSDDKISSYIDEYMDLIRDRVSGVRDKVSYLSSYVSSDYMEKINDSLSHLFLGNDYVSIKRGIPSRLPNLPKGCEGEAKEIKKGIMDAIRQIADLTRYDSMDEVRSSLVSTSVYVEAIIDVILKLDSMICDYKDSNGLYEFIDISKMAIRVVMENDDVRKELRGKYKEILVDEYQDTNDLQELFVSLISDDNVYMVGDVKQSIYRFRNANPSLFMKKYEEYGRRQGGKKIDLNKNFRSRKEVVSGINRLFNMFMDDKIGGASYFDSHQMVYGNKAYEEVLGSSYDMEILDYKVPDECEFSREEIEIFMIARDILFKVNSGYKVMDKDSLCERKVVYGDFAILMDRSNSFESYKKVFEYLGIPMTIYRDKGISSSSDVMVFRNVLNLILHVYDKVYDVSFKYSFMSALRSYLYGMDDDEVFRIVTSGDYKGTDLYSKCLALSQLIDECNSLELYDRIVLEFDFYSKVLMDVDVNGHIIMLDSIRKVVSNLNDCGYSPKMVYEYFMETSSKGIDITMPLNKESGDSVKIMTIHGSKGLEYYVCYFSGLYKRFNVDDLKNKFYYSTDYGFIVPYVLDGPKNSILKTLFKNRYCLDEVSERLRLFYVALTRAREKIIMVMDMEEKLFCFKNDGVINDEVRSLYRSFGDIINSGYDYLGEYVREVSVEDLGLTKDYCKSVSKSLDGGSGKVMVSEYDGDFSLVSSGIFSKQGNKLYSSLEVRNTRYGTHMHELFEEVDFADPDYSSMSEFEADKVKGFIASGILEGASNLYKEYEFIYEDDGKELHGIIDLLIEFDDKFVIVDYKLNNVTDEAYVKQLNGYRDYVRKMSGKRVYCYLYSVIQGELLAVS